MFFIAITIIILELLLFVINVIYINMHIYIYGIGLSNLAAENSIIISELLCFVNFHYGIATSDQLSLFC